MDKQINASNVAAIAKSWRIKKGLKQFEMAKMVGCSPPTYSRFESYRGKCLDDLVLNVLAIILPGFKSQIDILAIEADFDLTKPISNATLNKTGGKYEF